MRILPKSNQPFKTEVAAKLFRGRRHLENAKIVSIEGGFAIEVPDNADISAKVRGASIEIQKTDIEVKQVAKEETKEEIKEEKIKVKHKVTAPWKEAQLLNIPEEYKDKNFVYRFVRRDDINVNKKLQSGWEIDYELSKKMNPVPKWGKNSINVGTALDGTTTVMDTIVMRLPKERKEARDKWLREKQTTPAQMKKNVDSKIRELTSGKVATYGEIKVEKEEVIEGEN